MACNVVYKKSVFRDLKKVPKAETLRILDRIERDLAGTPEVNPVLIGRFAGLRNYRVGDESIVYVLTGTDIVILRIGLGWDVYRGEL